MGKIYTSFQTKNAAKFTYLYGLYKGVPSAPNPPPPPPGAPRYRSARAASLRYRNRAEITVFMCEHKSYPVWFSCRRMRKSYPVWCEDLSNLWLFTLEIGMTRHSLATSQKSPQNHRSCVWTEESLSYPVWFSKRRKSYSVWDPYSVNIA